MAASPYMDSMGLAPESVNLVTNAADSLASIGREARLCLKREGEAPAEPLRGGPPSRIHVCHYAVFPSPNGTVFAPYEPGSSPFIPFPNAEN